MPPVLTRSLQREGSAGLSAVGVSVTSMKLEMMAEEDVELRVRLETGHERPFQQDLRRTASRTSEGARSSSPGGVFAATSGGSTCSESGGGGEEHVPQDAPRQKRMRGRR